MECYYGLETEDLVVPTDQELLDMSSPSDSWPEWETGWTMKFDPVKKTDQKNHHKTPFGNPNSHTSLQESKNPYAFPMADGWSEDPWCGNATQHDRPDFQFNDLTRNDQMDDIFMSSLLKEDLPQPENSDEKSFSETRFCSMPADGNSTDLMFDSECVSGVIQSTGSPQNFRACVQSPSVKWEAEHVTTSSVSNGTDTGLNDHPIAKALESKVLHPPCEKGSNRQYRNSGGETSLDESLLRNLELSLTHLHQNTRLCFRDSLYRLAHNSIQQTSHHGRAKQADDQRIRNQNEMRRRWRQYHFFGFHSDSSPHPDFLNLKQTRPNSTKNRFWSQHKHPAEATSFNPSSSHVNPGQEETRQPNPRQTPLTEPSPTSCSRTSTTTPRISSP